jgi:hypothetical protein
MHSISSIASTSPAPLGADDPALFPRTPNLADPDVARLRKTLRAYFTATFDRYESLFECLSGDEAYYVKPISLRHPLIFYFGHTATFFVNKLLLARLIDQRIDARLESVFAVGVDEMSWDDLDDTHYEWPSVADVRRYRGKVRALITRLIDHAPMQSPIDWNSPWWAVIMGIEHERIHLETSSVLIRQHALKYVQPSENWAALRPEPGSPPDNELVRVPGGSVRVGKAFSSPEY